MSHPEFRICPVLIYAIPGLAGETARQVDCARIEGLLRRIPLRDVVIGYLWAGEEWNGINAIGMARVWEGKMKEIESDEPQWKISSDKGCSRRCSPETGRGQIGWPFFLPIANLLRSISPPLPPLPLSRGAAAGQAGGAAAKRAGAAACACRGREGRGREGS